MGRPRSQPPVCTVTEPAPCSRPSRARGLCSTHLSQLARTGRLALPRSRGSPRSMVPWRVPDWLIEHVRAEAERQGRPPGDVLEDALIAALLTID